MNNTKKGFTLVELLVVIAILAILATVSVVGYTAFINNANDSVAVQELTQIRNYMIAQDYNDDNFSITTANGLVFATGADWEDYVGEDQAMALEGEVTGPTSGVVTYTLSNGGSATWNTKTGEIKAVQD